MKSKHFSYLPVQTFVTLYQALQFCRQFFDHLFIALQSPGRQFPASIASLIFLPAINGSGLVFIRADRSTL